MQGKTPHAIGKILTAEGILTPAGKEKWQSSTIESILQNEKYRGDARLQKKFTVDFLQKRMKVNEGEVPQYYVENSHPAIIEPEEWDLVQAEFSRRKALGSRYSSNSVFSSMIFCGDCGSVYGSKVWHSTSKYRRTIWQCNDKFKGDHRCSTPHLYEKDIKELFLRAFSKLMANREHILEDIQLIQANLCDCTELDAQQATLAEEMEIVGELIRQCIEENTIKVQNQAEYLERYERHTHRYEKMQKQYEAIESEQQCRKEQHDRISAFATMLTEQSEMPIEFDDDLWLAAVDHATVNADETVTFTFKNGIEIMEQM